MRSLTMTSSYRHLQGEAVLLLRPSNGPALIVILRSYNHIMAQTTPIDSYDYIIIGGGLAGCVLASRLHEKKPSLSILLLEAGPDCTGHPLTSAPLACFGAHHSDLDWDYKTAPQKHLDGRDCYAAAGKVLSGGNAINYGSWTRGPKADYDHWAEVVGDQQWSYDGLLPYFKKTEQHYGDAEKDSQQHGFDGPIHSE
jgi:choline dehydrogenase-like flavoprotein